MTACLEPSAPEQGRREGDNAQHGSLHITGASVSACGDEDRVDQPQIICQEDSRNGQVSGLERTPPGDPGQTPQCRGPADGSALFCSQPEVLWLDSVRANPHLIDLASNVGGLDPLVPQKNVGQKEPPT